MTRRKISETIQQQVRKRANYLCEYCHTSEQWQYVQFTIDHVIPVAEGGTDDLENLALACFHCNRRKGKSRTGIDPQSGQDVRLYNPRLDTWNHHFAWSADRIMLVGVTAMGRAAIAILDMNRERVLQIRQADLAIARHPPPDDWIASDG